ncbi:MAG: Na+/H+ antiporter [Planctomycetia bacterium]|nr:Na+/H+ antiporter [Planctomycetia bacterium]
MHSPASTILLLLTAVTVLAFAARRLPIPYPTLMVVAGAAFGWIPGLPDIEFDSETVLLVFLPPLLYAASWQMPSRDFRENLRPISMLAVGLVVATTLAVAALTHYYIADMPWSLAFALGALVAPPDAVAATAVTRHVPLPRRLVTILEGESLVNDATGLVLYRVAVAAAVTGTFSPSAAALELIVAPLGGLVIGLAVGWLAVRLHRHLNDPTVETVATLLTPFAAYLPAEAIGTSGVLATVAAGMYVSHHASSIFSPATRLHATAVWNVLVFLLNGLAFILIGLQIPDVVYAVAQRPAGHVVGLTALVCLAVIGVRLLWVFPAAYLPKLFWNQLCAYEAAPCARNLAVLGWAGMRGVVTVAAALALPQLQADGSPLPHRDVLVLVAFAVVLATLVIQGQTLPAVIRWFHVTPESDHRTHSDAEVRREILTASMSYLDGSARTDESERGMVRHLRERYEHLLTAVAVTSDAHAGYLGRLQLEVLAEQRRKLAELNAAGTVSLETCRRIERILDLDEARVEEILIGPSTNEE